jgi:hypothetical protein
MRGSIRSASTATIAALITSSFWLVASAAEPDNRAPTKAAAQTVSAACSLLTKQDAAAALGGAVSGPEAVSDRPRGPGTTVSGCDYAGSGLSKVHLDLTRMGPSIAPYFRARCAKMGMQGLAGLGDVACWYNEKHEELHAIKGTAFISIQLKKNGDPTEAIKGVMKAALARLR